MNKINSILAGLFSLFLTIAVISNIAGWQISEQQAAAYDDGPALSGSLQTRQNEPNDQAKNDGGDESDSAIASGEDPAGPDVPQMDPAKDSPDAPVKSNVEGPVEENSDVQPVEDQKQPSSEAAKPAEISGGDKPAVDEQLHARYAFVGTKRGRTD